MYIHIYIYIYMYIYIYIYAHNARPWASHRSTSCRTGQNDATRMYTYFVLFAHGGEAV